ncbi:TPA: hypothetical protein ACS55K_002124 [Salmonella enterica]|nr:hypothetical protein [Salmonella enterica]EBW8600672.1 hypothetical protein [Salmonella enterica subsp. enterica serovar Thompson]EDS7651141.1 DUF1839 family protein [Salmonella enterica subsp. enterica serovar Thompson]EDV1609128.1 DUF1839 family protein [Salmonella enterica subsp. enterica serovar Thompson]EEO7019448.1 DUF1839 family protein [Salmonella enterica subsp. enterica serovar Virchow]
MKIIAQKPLYINGDVVTEGSVFETIEQHGRELINKGYAHLIEVDNSAQLEQLEQPEQPEQPEAKADKKARK